MSVIANYARLDEAALAALRNVPDWIEALYKLPSGGVRVLDIDKACDGIVWLLSRIPASLPPTEGSGFVLHRNLAPLLKGVGGREETEMMGDYWAPSVLGVQQVGDLAVWLKEISLEQLQQRYNPQAMSAEEIYPEIWDDESQTVFDDYLAPRFIELRKFFLEAAAQRQCVIVFFT